MAKPTAPTEHDNLLSGIRGQMAKIHTLIPGIVDSYDEETQTATVRPVVKFSFHAAGGGREHYEPGAIPNVPVAWQGSGAFSITWPLAKGEEVLLGFCERSIDEWKTVAGQAHKPGDARRFDLSDAIAFPLLRSPAVPLPAEGLDGVAMVIRAPELRLGSANASSFVALAPQVATQLAALKTMLDAWIPVAGDGGAALKTLWTALSGTGWPASTAATKVKAE